ncbi:MAG: glycosyltransferase family 4 protein [Caldilineaceae bacterium]|nr:glycosyltransferase family 4 protein [Caldilineaceae bacterium]
MKICYVANSCIPSRLANTVHVMKMCQAYQRLGHEVTLVVPDWLAGKASGVEDVYDFYAVEERFPIVRVPMPTNERAHTLFYSLTFPRAVARLESDVVHARVLTSAWSTAALFRLPTLLELHHPPPSSPYWRFFFDRSVRSRKTIGLVAITHALAEKYLRPVLPARTQIVIAPDGVDEAWLQDDLTRDRPGAGLD